MLRMCPIHDGCLSFCYRRRNTGGVLIAGWCDSTPRWEGDPLVLRESWQRLTGDRARGTSVVEEGIDAD